MNRYLKAFHHPTPFNCERINCCEVFSVRPLCLCGLTFSIELFPSRHSGHSACFYVLLNGQPVTDVLFIGQHKSVQIILRHEGVSAVNR